MRKEKKWKQLVRKTTTHAKQTLNHYLRQVFISFYYSKKNLFLFSQLHEFRNNAIPLIRWPITATAIAKRNTVNKEILINIKSFAHVYKRFAFN